MRTREHWLGLCIALVIGLWSGRAEAWSITANPINCGSIPQGSTTTCSATLSHTSGGMYDLALDAACDATAWSITPTQASFGSRTITATFTARAAGQSDCTVRVYDKNTTDLQFSFGLRGFGQTPAAISVAQPSSFGSVRYNNNATQNTLTKTITVGNTGDQALVISALTIPGGAPFAVQGGGPTLPATITKGNNKQWVITFNPDAPVGAKSSTLTIVSNDPDGDKVLNLDGTATTASISVSATEILYGLVSEGSSRSDVIPVMNPAVANGGPLGVTRAVISGSPFFTFTSCSNPSDRDCMVAFSVANGTQTNVGVKCTTPTPAGTTVDQTATVTFTSDSDGGTAYTANLRCKPGVIQVKAATSSYDFGKKLVIAGGGTSITTQIMVSNTGTQGATLGPAVSGGTSGQFSVKCSDGNPTCAILPMPMGGSPTTQMIDITFTPTAEGDLLTNLEINLDGGTKNGPTVALTGRGTDKHLGLLTDIEFLETYRNPGSKAPEQLVPVTNTGEYELQVTDMSILDDAAGTWQLSQPFMPFTVPPLSSVPVGVKFLPQIEGKAPMGLLHIEANDIVAAQGIQTINLNGNGKLRNVDMTPGSIDVGETFAGIPARLSITRPGDILTVKNMDDTVFTIRNIAIEGADASMFRLVTVDGTEFSTVDIDPLGSVTFDVVFSPPYPGDFEATVGLYLDEDPIAQQPVPIRGRALFLNAHGSGGCSTGGDAGGAIVLLVVGGIVIGRRRRR